ncbi:uncharacterized protein LOC116724101 isoform X1 [Xiphophorus hellerii]|uniref:uncharacterized protein LOC116724101 isoform X1 n=1 Tax=Xiphophorus hellerii TaxID=8084 RepID=UPI0013B446FA|nr:uncharacterized protein LOC116724101 isoform X1 [Xiphophorus hellerii]
MSETNDTEIEVASAEQAAEAEQVDETSLVQPGQEELRRSERPRMLTGKGKEFHKEKLKELQRHFESTYDRWKALIKVAKKSVIKGDPVDILEGHMDIVQRELAALNDIYDQYRAIDGPPHDMRSKLDKCISVTKVVMQNIQCHVEGTNKEEIVWPDASSVFTSSSSASVSVHSHFKASTVISNGSSAKRQEAAAEYEATKAVLKIMAEQEKFREKMQTIEEEDKCITAEQEAAAMLQRHQEEREETERKLKREKEKAAVIKRQQEESAARKRSVEDLKREIERLENLKGLNAARAKLQVYEEDYFSVKQESITPNPANIQVTEFKNTVNQPTQPPQQLNVVHESTGELVRVLAEAMSANRLPIPEPSVFNGDPLKFKHWKASFQTLIERKNIPIAEKIFFLQKYVGGCVKEALDGYFLIGSEDSYMAAWNILNERYGEPFVIAKAFRDKLHTWPKLQGKDSAELRKFVDFLQSCQSAMTTNENLNVLNDGIENQRLAAKLPDWLSNRWNRKATEYQLEHRQFPRFSYFVTFLSMEASIACNPITSYQAIRQSDFDKPRTKPQITPIHKKQDTTKIFTTNSTERSMSSCVFCKRTGHSLHKCRKFTEKPVTERVKFIQGEKLCFGCLNSGHFSKNCSDRMTCNTCSKQHPTCLHEERQRHEIKKEQPKEQEVAERKETQQQVTQSQDTANESTSNRVTHENRNTQTSAIVPVYVSTQNEPSKEILTYALLDTQSDSSFILNEVANNLNTAKTQVKLKLSTMSSKKTTVPCTKLEALQIRGLFSKKKLTVPVAYTRDFIPANRSHIPTPDTARSWPHLEHLTEHIAPPLDCDIGLLLGYNCTQALMPREVICGEENQPYAQKTDLGWSIISYCDSCDASSDVIGVSHRITVKQVIPETEPTTKLKNKVHYICKTQIKEVTGPDVIKALESDFTERAVEETSISQEDVCFIRKLQEGIKQKQDGHYEMPLPFKNDRPNLPNNMSSAMQRLNSLKRRFIRDPKYYSDYAKFMEDIIARGDAEKVTEKELCNSPAWYIPHHGVYHPQKPGKIRVVFDCSAQYQDTSLNEHLLTGPDLTNTLVGVLCRFRKGSVAVMCDVERMFHQFHVTPQDQDYLRFLWWEHGDLSVPLSVFRMKVHLFGAASSPGCANFGLKHLATQGEGRFSPNTVKFIQRNFYVDDGLVSVTSEAEAIKLVKEARELCSTGQLRLHKFVSNSDNVLKSLPREECADSIKDLGLALGEPLMERALGVQWCISSDEFQFRITVKEHQMTRRGILCTVASVYDPLGFVAPFILKGKQILQQLCQEKVGWDEPLSDQLYREWESWLLDLQNLSKVRIQRCMLPENTDITRCDLHHFSDASVTGYGQCSYLRTVTSKGDVHCALVMGKARVAPTKVTTVPRLELTAAVVAARTSVMLKSELEISNLQEHFWTDSKVVLGYVNNDAKRFHVFVANRIQRIKSLTNPHQWHHVPSENNPADHASRGLSVQQLLTSNWFKGPEFLWQSELPIETDKAIEVIPNDPELKTVHVLKTEVQERRTILDRLNKFSDWRRAVKAIARLKKFVRDF